MFNRVLIANRGEVALRVIRACREMGIPTVAVYSEADRDSLHVRYADDAVCIGPPPSAQSYLNIPQIISAAVITQADAIHPGYGFLAENDRFAENCEACEITFIGPSAETIRRMGDKAEAKRTVRKAGVPVIPGSDGVIETVEEAVRVAGHVGYPVIVKAAGGGGGRGMRVAHTEVALQNAFFMAQSEAQSAFDNPQVYIEKLFERPRHVEVQILADRHGRVVHLGERDCSIQRRHQKLIEESPGPSVTAKLRGRMGEAAVRAAKAVSYVGAGTVEFLLDGDGRFYFMEMNTRIQVEHPVTEMVTGVDIVKKQIQAAAGEKFAFRQDGIRLQGHAIECRINAEDPENEFLPAPGRITVFHPPGGAGVRVDSHAYSEYAIPPHYDSLIAKLIVHDDDRPSALKRMERALDEFVIEGIKTTIPFHQRVLRDERFRRGEYDVTFLDTLER
ncbi:acetyl-CoA carboxylase biotin carboxylase subunit [candidate division BRC1 bacterium SM23_51]|nr:MAG: acetyl-CoA carboxylase biotin carboxylase subunit [candidate division BRC1 bacterium SM23_51]